MEYFLHENKKGYCTHFASAATVILRAMGVPTRYVEGYVIKKSDADNASLTSTEMLQKDKGWFIGEAEAIKEFGITKQQFNSISIDNYIFKRKTESTQCEVKTMKIKDTNAHAWIEVYIDNIGWIPVDVTPGFGDNIQDVINKKVDKKEAVTSENNNSNDTKITSENTTDNNTSEETYISKSESVQMANYSMPSILKVITIVAGILFVITVSLILRNRIIIINRKKSFTIEDDNKNVHNIYKYLMQIFKYAGVENKENLPACEYEKILKERYSFIKDSEFVDLINILFKADFSKHKISKEEFEKVISFTNKFNDETYNKLSRIQKLNYTYLKNLR